METDPMDDGVGDEPGSGARREARTDGARQRSDFGPFGDGLGAMTSLQRQGIAAASEVFERFGSIFDRLNRGAGFDPTRRADGPEGRVNRSDFTRSTSGVGSEGPRAYTDGAVVSELRAAAARSLDTYTSVFQSTFEAYADLMEGRMRERGIRIGADGSDRAAASGPAGGRATGSLWIHNDTPEPTGQLHLSLTDGRSATGLDLESEHIRLIPDVVEVPAHSSANVEIEVDLTGIESTHFHALVLVREIPDEALLLTITAHESSSSNGRGGRDVEDLPS